MKKADDLADRRKAATAAKAALLEKFKARPAADDPEVLAKAAARQAIAAAREERIAARQLSMPEGLSPAGASLLDGLLTLDPAARMGGPRMGTHRHA